MRPGRWRRVPRRDQGNTDTLTEDDPGEPATGVVPGDVLTEAAHAAADAIAIGAAAADMPGDAPGETTESSAETVACIFCGRPSGQVAYAWPDWLCRFLAEQPALWDRGSEPVIDLEIMHRMDQEADRVVDCVCQNCVHGWIQRLDDKVREFFEPMIAGEPTPLPSARRRLLARWAAKTALVLEWTTGGAPRTPRDELEHLRKGTVHPGTQVFAGRYDGHRHMLSGALSVGTHDVDGEPTPVFQTSLLVGRVLLRVVADPAHERPPEPGDHTPGSLIALVGNRRRNVEWPPAAAIGDEQLGHEHFAGHVDDHDVEYTQPNDHDRRDQAHGSVPERDGASSSDDSEARTMTSDEHPDRNGGRPATNLRDVSGVVAEPATWNALGESGHTHAPTHTHEWVQSIPFTAPPLARVPQPEPTPPLQAGTVHDPGEAPRIPPGWPPEIFDQLDEPPAHDDKARAGGRWSSRARKLAGYPVLVAVLGGAVITLAVVGLHERTNAHNAAKKTTTVQARNRTLQATLRARTQQLGVAQTRLATGTSTRATLPPSGTDITGTPDQLRQIAASVPAVTNGLRSCAEAALATASSALDVGPAAAAGPVPARTTNAVDAAAVRARRVCQAASAEANALDDLVSAAHK